MKTIIVVNFLKKPQSHFFVATLHNLVVKTNNADVATHRHLNKFNQ